MYKPTDHPSKTNELKRLKDLQGLKQAGKKFAMLTAYDATIARILDEQGIEVVLVGDSLGMVVQGHAKTAMVTLADMEYHTRIVKRGTKNAVLMADVPMACNLDTRMAAEAALRLIRAGADIVKFETHPGMLPIIKDLSQAGIPLCAHLGLLPQQALKEGGYKVKGRSKEDAQTLAELAVAAEKAGADMLLLECVVDDLAKKISSQVKIPVVGIGCGEGTDAQVLVIYDLLGLNPRPARFCKNFLAETDSIGAAVALFREQVLQGKFPGKEHVYSP